MFQEQNSLQKILLVTGLVIIVVTLVFVMYKALGIKIIIKTEPRLVEVPRLTMAFENNDLNKIRNMLMKNPELLNSKFEFLPKKKHTPLEFAILSEDTEIIDLLIVEFKADYKKTLELLKKSKYAWGVPILEERLNNLYGTQWRTNPNPPLLPRSYEFSESSTATERNNPGKVK